MSVEVPKWKKELILKKQQWKSQGGWSVPPHPVCTTPRTFKPNVSANFERKPSKIEFNGPICKLEPRKKRPTSAHKTDIDLADPTFGSVSDLKAIFQRPMEDFQPMTKSRSVENILDDEPVVQSSRRASASNFDPFGQKKTKAVPSMEDFFKKYRKAPSKKITVVADSSNVQPNRNARKDKTVFFVDMNENELPTPNIVKETLKVFEDPQNPGNPRKSAEVPEDVIFKTRDVVRKFEAKIKSQPENLQKQPSAPKTDVRKSEKLQDLAFDSEENPGYNDKEGSFGPDGGFSTDPRIFNVVMSTNSTVLTNGNSPTEEKISDLKTVTINTNQSIIIKTI